MNFKIDTHLKQLVMSVERNSLHRCAPVLEL